ncbi:MAG: HAMP domain-containing histidine kinase [Alphaproteobacteria bacterium]|nr:HAMP domain-containing histidine kinase [Alphaproteobacteria bacterium]
MTKRIATSLQFGQPEKAIADLQDFEQKESIQYVCVFDKSQKIFVQRNLNQIIKKSCPSVSHYSNGYSFTWDGLILVTSIFSKKGENIGQMVIKSDLRDIYKELQVSFVALSVTLIGVIALGYFLASALQNIISSPLIELSHAARAVTKGNYDVQVSTPSYGEIQELTADFNIMVKVAKDLKENLEQKVDERTEDLEYALKVKTDFLSNMSHEIRTPIHGVTSFTRLLVEEWDTTDDVMLFNYAQRAHKSGERLLILINNLLDMSKFEKGAIQLERRELLFSDLIKTVIAETGGLAEAKHLKVEFEPMANETLVDVDEGRMVQVITNIIGNAVKYSQKGTISICQSINPEAIFLDGVAQVPGMVITVADEGIGIPESELTKIFDKFFESSFTKTKAGGTGLGLAICREIVKAHLGTIWAENNESGMGSTFTFIFPLKEIPGVTQITDKYV